MYSNGMQLHHRSEARAQQSTGGILGGMHGAFSTQDRELELALFEAPAARFDPPADPPALLSLVAFLT
jgi:hypothetical protein